MHATADTQFFSRLARIIHEKNLDATPGPVEDEPHPDLPGHPTYHHRQRVNAALTKFERTAPPRYLTATTDHPVVCDWADRVAADITQVHEGRATAEYQDPALFFRRTFVTEGMGLLLESVAKRLSGKGGEGGVHHMSLGVFAPLGHSGGATGVVECGQRIRVAFDCRCRRMREDVFPVGGQCGIRGFERRRRNRGTHERVGELRVSDGEIDFQLRAHVVDLLCEVGKRHQCCDAGVTDLV